MKLFSQRNNLSPIRVEIQKDSMDDKLRNKLWSAFYQTYGKILESNPTRDGVLMGLVSSLYIHFYSRPIDEVPFRGSVCLQLIRDSFMAFEWYKVYDFCEAVVAFSPSYRSVNFQLNFTNACNIYLEQELSAYRIVDGKVTEITSETEISAIEDAISTSPDHVQDHLRQALALFSDRENPDYRNSIKESISAVEALCQKITGNSKATLGQALKEIKRSDKLNIPEALVNAYSNIYGYTSDADGIRHAMIDVPNLSAEDARFMLVSCSSFINYLTVKADKAGSTLNS